MIAILQLLAILGLGYVGTHYLAQRVRARFHIETGIEFVVLGVLVGPHVTDVMQPEVLVQLGPVISLAIGAMGLILGLEFRVSQVLSTRREALGLSFAGVVSTFVVVGGLATFWIYAMTPASLGSALPASVALGAIAAVSATGAISTVHREMEGEVRLAHVLASSVRFDQLQATVLFGLVFCLFHLGETAGVRALTSTEWFAVSLGIGVVLGGLFFLFLGRERDPGRLLLALIGIILFSSGAAYYLNLSPLFVNMVLGVILANTSQLAPKLREVLGEIKGPLSVVILVLAGASWNLSTLGNSIVIGFIVICLVGRPLGKALGGSLAFRYAEPAAQSHLTPSMGTGSLAHGSLAVAMAVNFREVYSGIAVDGLFSAVLLSVLVWEVLAPGAIRRVLIDSEPALAPRTTTAT